MPSDSQNSAFPATSSTWGLALLVLLALAASGYVRLQNLDRPFESARSTHEHADAELNTPRHARVVRNYLRFGVIPLAAAPIDNSEPADLEALYPYANHPPLSYFLALPGVLLLGDTEAGHRIMAILFGIAAVWLLFLLLRNRWGIAAAFWGALTFLCLPQMLKFSNTSTYETYTLVLILASWLLYDRSRRSSSLCRSILFLITFTAAALSDWPGFFLVPALWTEALLRRSLRAEGRMLAIVTSLAVVLGLSLFAWTDAVLERFPLGAMQEETLAASQLSQELFSDRLLTGRWWLKIAQHFLSGAGFPLAIAAALGLLAALLVRPRVPSPSRRSRFATLLALLVLGAANLLLFPGHAWFHAYWSYYLHPACAAAVGLLLALAVQYAGRLGGKSVQATVVVLFLGSLTYLGITHHRDYCPSQFPISEHSRFERKLALQIRKLTEPSDFVLLSYPVTHSFAYYAERRILGSTASVKALSPEHRSLIREAARPALARGGRITLCLPANLQTDLPASQLVATSDEPGVNWSVYDVTDDLGEPPP